MRKRTIGVGAGVLVVLGILLGTLFRGPGLGEGDGDEEGGPGDADVQVAMAPEAVTSVEPPPSDVAEEIGQSGAADVLTVVVDDDDYLIQTGADARPQLAPATLEELVAAAREAEGDEFGVRVRMRFTTDAKNGAINDLRVALAEAGVESQAVIEDTEFIEE